MGEGRRADGHLLWDGLRLLAARGTGWGTRIRVNTLGGFRAPPHATRPTGDDSIPLKCTLVERWGGT